MAAERVKITVSVPPEATDKIRQAFGEAGAGVIGDYTFCSFAIKGKGYSKPTQDADPHIGTPGKLEIIDEELISVVCDRDKASDAIAAIKKVHPYEQLALDIIPLLNEEDL